MLEVAIQSMALPTASPGLGSCEEGNQVLHAPCCPRRRPEPKLPFLAISYGRSHPHRRMWVGLWRAERKENRSQTLHVRGGVMRRDVIGGSQPILLSATQGAVIGTTNPLWQEDDA